MKPWLSIIGVGPDGVSGLSPVARALTDNAEIIVGPPRMLAGADFGKAELHLWSSPLSEMVARIEGWRGRNVVILPTGDPMHYGIGATMARRVPVAEMTIIPSLSAFSLAAARLGWALQDVETVSLHGRPVALVEPLIQPGARILVLTSGATTVRDVAERLVARGYGPSRLIVLEEMGGADERVAETRAAEAGEQEFQEFNTLAIDCIADPAAPLLPRVPGLPDDAFRHDGQLTKREVRAVTLAALGPGPGALLWDVGAGSGAVAIEWMRAARNAQAIAFERDEARLATIAENAAALGTPGLEIVTGDLPGTLADQPQPSAVFVGGAVAENAVMERCWATLPAGGRLVANAVTLEGEAMLGQCHAAHGGELVRIGVSEAQAIGNKRGFRPRMTVTQWRAVKQ